MGHSAHEKAMANLFMCATYLRDVIKLWETYAKALEECSKRWKKAKTQNIDAKTMSLHWGDLAATYNSVIPGLKMAEETLRDHHNFEIIPPLEKLGAIHTLIGIVLTEHKKQGSGPGTVYRWNSDYAQTKHAMQPLNDIGPGFSDDALKALYSYLVPLSEYAKRNSQ